MKDEIRSFHPPGIDKRITTSKDHKDFFWETMALAKKVCAMQGHDVSDGMALYYICAEFRATYGDKIVEE